MAGKLERKLREADCLESEAFNKLVGFAKRQLKPFKVNRARAPAEATIPFSLMPYAHF